MEESVFRKTRVNAQKVIMGYAVNTQNAWFHVWMVDDVEEWTNVDALQASKVTTVKLEDDHLKEVLATDPVDMGYVDQIILVSVIQDGLEEFATKKCHELKNSPVIWKWNEPFLCIGNSKNETAMWYSY